MPTSNAFARVTDLNRLLDPRRGKPFTHGRDFDVRTFFDELAAVGSSRDLDDYEIPEGVTAFSTAE